MIGLGFVVDEDLGTPAGGYLSLAGFAVLGITLLVVPFGSDGSPRATEIIRPAAPSTG